MVAIAKRLVSAHKVSLLQREHFKATHDPLTGLINQVALDERIEHEISIGARYNKSFALLMLEIDHFQDLAQNFSKTIANKLLIDFAKRLKNCVRSTDTVARFEDNLFVILLPDVPNIRNVVKVIQSVNVDLMTPFSIDEKELTLSPTIGVSLYPSDGESKQQVLEQAHIAMCQARNDNERNYRYYSVEADSEVAHQIAAEDSIRSAIDSHKYEIHYQPVHALSNNVTSYVESNVHWGNSELHGISLDFISDTIDSMELSKLFSDIMLTEICRQISTWEAGRAHTKIPVLFKVAHSQFADRDLAHRLDLILKNQHVSPESIALVIDEKSITENVDQSIHQIKTLKQAGFKIVIDKFCCGLSYIGKLSNGLVDLIRIDSKITDELDSHMEWLCIVEGIIKIVNQLEIATIISGVDNEQQHTILRNLACAYWQGDFSYLMGSVD